MKSFFFLGEVINVPGWILSILLGKELKSFGIWGFYCLGLALKEVRKKRKEKQNDIGHKISASPRPVNFGLNLKHLFSLPCNEICLFRITKPQLETTPIQRTPAPTRKYLFSIRPKFHYTIPDQRPFNIFGN